MSKDIAKPAGALRTNLLGLYMVIIAIILAFIVIKFHKRLYVRKFEFEPNEKVAYSISNIYPGIHLGSVGL